MRPVNEVQSFLAQKANSMRAKPTPAEKAMCSILDEMRVRYKFQSIKFSKGTYRIFDFYLPKKRIAIEVDGPYHDPEYDSARDSQLNSKHDRLKMLRFTNRQVLERPSQVKSTLFSLLA